MQRAIRLPGYILIVGSLALQCWAQRTPSLSLSLGRQGASLVIELEAKNTGSFLVEESADLKTWKPFMAVFSKVPTTNAAQMTYSGDAHFYRAVQPGRTAAELLEGWRAHGPKDYRYTFS